MQHHLYMSRLEMPIAERRATIHVLQARLSDALDLAAQLKQAHWNVRGPLFAQLHRLFDEIAETVEDSIDEIAERIVSLGGIADGRIGTTAAQTSLYEYPTAARQGVDHLRALAGSLGIHAARVREAAEASAAIGDAGTADLFTGISRQTDKQLWLVEAHLDEPVTPTVGAS